MIEFRVNGKPAPQGSKRHVGNGRMVEMSKALAPWREAVRAEAQRTDAGPLIGAVKLHLDFFLPRPRGHFGKRGLLPSAPAWPITGPDLDKLVRAVQDGIVAGGVLADDKLTVNVVAFKRYATDEQPPGVWVMLRDVGDE